ncbi:hypothetical protein ACFCP7_22460 [Paenibacillus elgii]
MKNLLFVVLISSNLLLYGCSNEKKPDFIGYIFNVDKKNDNTVVVGIREEDNQATNVLLKPGASTLEIGSKVEVYFTHEGVNSTFPLNAPAKLKEIKTPKTEKEIIGKLFRYLYEKHGNAYYPSIISITENETYWVIKVNETSTSLDYKKNVEYRITKGSFDINTVNNQ